MIEQILTQANIRTRTFFEQYRKMADDETALIMACADSGQSELVQPLLQRKKEDQQILEDETYAVLMPRVELYPEVRPFNAIKEFGLDDFLDVTTDSEEDEVCLPEEDQEAKKNDDE